MPVGAHVETATGDVGEHHAGIRVRLLGPLTVLHAGAHLELPASRKTRALFGYLALAGEAVGRSRLCELLWELPSDPRGELRWCLSKIRAFLGRASSHAVETSGERVQLHLEEGAVDALELAEAAKAIDRLDIDQLRAAASRFTGDFLEGLEVDRSPLFMSWLTAQRRRFRSLQATCLEHLARRLPAKSPETVACLEQWVQLEPTDTRANAMLLTGFLQTGRAVDGERHLHAAAGLFEDAKLDFGPVRAAWRLARSTATPTACYAQASSPACTQPLPVCSDRTAPTRQRASLAVMPLVDGMRADFRGGLADGLTDDIITRLAKLRSLFVIARGSAFALAEGGVGAVEAGRILGVDYVVSGAARREAGRVAISIELSEVQTARIVWSEMFDRRLSNAFEAFDEIGNGIVASISSEIETVERNRAVLKPPECLNAWEAYHRGLWHMYRFTRAENERARHFFQTAVSLDPTFAGGYAGLSFTHWQNAFQHWGDRDRQSDLALDAAGMSLHVDEQSPTAHWAMGRALWLRGNQEESLRELEQAVQLSPNFALGHYTLAFVHSQTGDAEFAIRASDLSQRLSPFDPLLFAMLSSKAVSLVRLGRFEEATKWALKGAARPNAHNIILATAAHCLGFQSRLDEARSFVGLIRRSAPGYSVNDYLTSFRFQADDAALFRENGKRIGLE
jgi:DNA-binding SARP family transcriptional activator/TolB-like protein